VGHEGFGEDVLDEPEHDADVDVFDVEGNSPFLAGVHHSNCGLVVVLFGLVQSDAWKSKGTYPTLFRYRQNSISVGSEQSLVRYHLKNIFRR
jgi:hypothetical protein